MIVFRLRRMHEMQTIVTDVRGVCPSVCLSRGGACSVCGGHSVQALPNCFGILLYLVQNRRVGSRWHMGIPNSRPVFYLCIMHYAAKVNDHYGYVICIATASVSMAKWKCRPAYNPLWLLFSYVYRYRINSVYQPSVAIFLLFFWCRIPQNWSPDVRKRFYALLFCL